jgi:HSP20 family molecular chaperone IbpA
MVLMRFDPLRELDRLMFLGDNLDPGKMSASCERGVLTLVIPQTGSAQQQTVDA